MWLTTPKMVGSPLLLHMHDYHSRTLYNNYVKYNKPVSNAALNTPPPLSQMDDASNISILYMYIHACGMTLY